jgi:hypothetical protein
MNIFDIFKSTIKQIFSLRRLLIYIYAPSFLLFLVVGIVTKLVPNLSIQDFLRDVTAIGDIPFYSGSISQLGLLLWSAATTICLFTYFTLRKIDSSRKQSLNLLMFGGLLSGYLMLDDTYLLHEEVFPKYIDFIPEKAIILLLGIAMLSFIYFNRHEILKGEYGLLFLAYLFLGISVFLDAIPSRFYENILYAERIEYFLEDGAKFIAIVTWLVFFVRYSYQQLSKLFSQKP